MRINVNLASQQYRDAREFYFRWGAALVLLFGITLALAFLAWSNHSNSVRDTRRIRELRDKIAMVDNERRQAEEVLNRPENQDVRDQSQYWNDVIDEKSFSWTQLFSDLEKIMPARAYLTSAEPSITNDNKLQLKLVVAGEKYDDAYELLHKMERSERFKLPVLHSTGPRSLGSGAAGTVVEQFEIVTYYTPASPVEQPHVSTGKEGL
jgi:Tfp pilus assembly protein PilN